MVKKIISKAKNLSGSYWFRSGSQSLMAKVFDAGFGLLTYMLLTRDLTEHAMGVWIIFMIISGGLESLRNAFVYNALVRYINISEESDRQPIMAASFMHNLLYTVLFSLLLVGIASPMAAYWNEPAPELETMLYVLAGNNLLMLFYSQFLYIQQASLQFKGLLYLSFLRKGLLLAYVLYFYFIIGRGHIDLIDLTWCQLLITFLLIPLAYVLTRPMMGKGFKGYHKWMADLFHFGKYNIGTNLGALILGSIDSWMLGKLISTKATALYNPAIKVMNLVEVPLLSLANVFYPKVTQGIRDRGEVAAKEMYEISVAAILMVMLPVALIIIVFAGPLVNIMAGPKYVEAVPILRITALFALVIPFNRQFGVVANALGKARLNLIFVLLNAGVNAVSNYIFIKRYGVIGAAYGTLAAYLVSMVYTQFLMHRMLGVSSLRIIGKALAGYRDPMGMLRRK